MQLEDPRAVVVALALGRLFVGCCFDLVSSATSAPATTQQKQNCKHKGMQSVKGQGTTDLLVLLLLRLLLFLVFLLLLLPLLSLSFSFSLSLAFSFLFLSFSSYSFLIASISLSSASFFFLAAASASSATGEQKPRSFRWPRQM